MIGFGDAIGAVRETDFAFAASAAPAAGAINCEARPIRGVENSCAIGRVRDDVLGKKGYLMLHEGESNRRLCGFGWWISGGGEFGVTFFYRPE